MATLIDVISVEERYQNALLTQVERRRNYAVSLARLSHELGALVRLAEGRFEIDERSLTELFPR